MISPENYATIELTKQFLRSEPSDPKFHFSEEYTFVLEIATNETSPIPVSLSLTAFSELSNQGILMAACILILLYVLIIFEIIDRTLASMVGATAAIACLTLIGNVSRYKVQSECHLMHTTHDLYTETDASEGDLMDGLGDPVSPVWHDDHGRCPV